MRNNKVNELVAPSFWFSADSPSPNQEAWSHGVIKGQPPRSEEHTSELQSP